MKILSQFAVFCAVLAAGVYVWIAYVPAAHPLLIKTGLPDLLGFELPEPAPQQATGRRRGGGAAQVIAAPVAERTRIDRVTAIGDGKARRSVTVRSNAVGVIEQILIASGSYVEQGTIIAKLQDENEQIALARAQIQLDDATSDAERIRQLESSGATSAVRLREVQLALSSAELAVRQAQFDLSQRQIVAPLSGWVGILELEDGDRVNSQDVVVEITDRSYILIDFRVPERVVTKMSVGQAFDVSAVGFSGDPLAGEIRAIDPVVDRASRTVLVRGRVANDQDALRAGMAFSVGLSFPGETVLSIPPLAVQWSSDGPYVWAVREGKAANVPVALVQRNSSEVLVTSSDLVAGELVVTEGVQSLRSGADVTLANAPDPAQVTQAARSGADQ